MTESTGRKEAPDLFGGMTETDRRRALDIFGQMLMQARDTAIIQWDQILAGTRNNVPWDRILRRLPPLDAHSRVLVGEALPNIIDTFIYCFLAELDGSQSV